MRHMPLSIYTVAHKVDMKVQHLAMPLDLHQLASAWREIELADAKDFLLARDRQNDDQLNGQLALPARMPSM